MKLNDLSVGGMWQLPPHTSQFVLSHSPCESIMAEPLSKSQQRLRGLISRIAMARETTRVNHIERNSGHVFKSPGG